MARDAELRARITAQDDASKVIDDVAAKADALAGTKAQVAVTADTEAAEADLETIVSEVEAVDGAAAEVEATADTADAVDALDEVVTEVEEVDGATAEVAAEADTSAAVDALGEVVDVVEEVDGTTAKVEVTADTTGFAGAMTAIKGELQALAAGGSVSTAASGIWSTISKSAGVGLAGAGAAVGAFAVKAISDFNEVAMGAGELRDTLGLTAEQASRWQEVAGDLGVSNGSLESIIGKMNKTLGTTPGLFKDIVREASGGIDVNATFLNIIDHLNGIVDPAERARQATKLLGKSWTEVAELINLGADDVRQALEEVSDAKVAGDDQIADAREFRDALDDLKGVIEDISISVGQDLVPAVSDAMSTISALVGPLKRVKDGFDDLTNVPVIKQVYDNFAPWRQLPTRIEQVQTAWHALFGEPGDGQKGEIVKSWADEYNKGLESTRPATEDAIRRQEEWIATLEGSPNLANQSELLAAARDKLADLNAEMEKTPALMPALISASEQHAAALATEAAAQDALREATEAYVDSLNNQIDGMKNAADAQLAANDALEDFGETLGDSKASVDDVRDSAIKLAEAEVAVTEAQYASLDATASATAKLDAQNSSLLNTAATAKGPARDAILDYTAAVNGIPPEKMTEIKAAIARGDIAEAQRLLDEASRARTAAIIADANTAQAESDIQKLIRTRNMTINANIVAHGGAGYGGVAGPSAGPRSAPMTAPPPPTTVTAGPTATVTDTATVGASVPINVHVPPATVNVAAPVLPPIVVKLDGRPVAALIGSTTAPAVRAAAMTIRAGRA